MVKLQVIGHLGKDGTLNTVNGKNVINFSVAHTEKYRDAQGQQKDKTLWVECAYWTDRTAVLPYLKRGTQVYAEGVPDMKTYTTGDGRQGASLTLRVMSVQLLGGKGDAQQGSETSFAGTPQSTYNQPQSSVAPSETDALDDLPF